MTELARPVSDPTRKSDMYRKLVYLFAILLILCAAMIIILSVFLGINTAKNNNTGQETKSQICTTSACVGKASAMLRNLDETVDPCEDFYQFSCGNFNKNNRLEDSQNKISEFSILRDQMTLVLSDLLAQPIAENDTRATANAKNLYASCFNEDLIEERGTDYLLEVISSEFGGWPILDNNPSLSSSKPTKEISILDKMIRLKRVESSQLFELFVSTNPKNPRRNVLRVMQPSWFFATEYLSNTKVIEAYKSLMKTVIGYLVPSVNLTKQIDSIFEIENEFAKLQIEENIRRSQVYKNFTIGELAEEIPDFDWKEFIINGVFKDIENITITDDEVILVDDIDYLRNATKLYSELIVTRKQDYENLLMWILVKDVISFLPQKFQDAKLDFDRAYRGTKEQPKRYLLCTNMVNSRLDDVVGRLYVSHYFDKTAKDHALEMVQNLLLEFKEILEETDWMDEVSKKKAIEKANLIDVKIGYSDKIYNDTYLNEQHSGVNFTATEFLQNHYSSIKASVNRSLSQLRKTVEPHQWISGAAVVNAFYNPPSNQITFPAGILQAPFYDAKIPNYLNYGGIGTVIGHEITHGFDDVGRLYDKDGVYFSDEESESLWTNTTVANYLDKVQCIIDQYSNYTVKQVNKTVDGINTQGENIADIGGIKESFRAYKKWQSRNPKELLLPGLEKYNQDQMFFINFGQIWCGKYRDEALINALISDPHTPGQFRVIGSTSNLREFSQTFKCKANQTNNPDKKCLVW